MAKLPQFRRILREDFKDQPWIEKLLLPLNAFMDSMVTALNRGLTFSDNFSSKVHEFRLVEDDITYPIKVAWDRKTLPTDMIVTRIVLVSGSNPTAAVQARWEYDGESILVNKFTGLDSSSEYKIRCIIFTG